MTCSYFFFPIQSSSFRKGQASQGCQQNMEYKVLDKTKLLSLYLGWTRQSRMKNWVLRARQSVCFLLIPELWIILLENQLWKRQELKRKEEHDFWFSRQWESKSMWKNLFYCVQSKRKSFKHTLQLHWL